MERSQDPYEARELQWQLCAKAGNQRMQANRYQDAEQSYSKALELAGLLLEEAKQNADHRDAIHLYVISCHNLADCQLNLGDIQQAKIILQQAFNQVIEIMNDECLPHPLRLEAFKALKVVSFEIDSFYRSLNQVEQAQTIFEEAIAQAQNFLARSDCSQTVSPKDLIWKTEGNDPRRL